MRRLELRNGLRDLRFEHRTRDVRQFSSIVKAPLQLELTSGKIESRSVITRSFHAAKEALASVCAVPCAVVSTWRNPGPSGPNPLPW